MDIKNLGNSHFIPVEDETIKVLIPLDEYKELLIIKGRYEELKDKYTDKYITIGNRTMLTEDFWKLYPDGVVEVQNGKKSNEKHL